MSRMKTQNPQRIRQYIVFLAGLFFMGLGIALVTKSNLGTSPISSVPYVLSMTLPISMGTLIFLLCTLFFFIELMIVGKKFPKKQYLQLLVGPIFGVFIDLGMAIFSFLDPSLYFVKIVELVIGCILLALGIYLQIAANTILNPGEGVVKVIADKVGKEFGNVKMMFDGTLVLVALMVSFVAFGSIEGLGEGTIISAFLVGFFVKLISRIGNKIVYKNKLENAA